MFFSTCHRIISVTIYLLILTSLVAHHLYAQDTALIEEKFDYAIFNPLNWADGGKGWSGEWIRTIGDDLIVREGDLFDTSQNDPDGLHLAVDVANVGVRYDRRIPLIHDDGQSIWCSVMLNFGLEGNANNVGNITLTRNGNQVFSFGKIFGGRIFGFAWSGGTKYESDISTDDLHRVVIKLEFSGNNEQEEAWLWIDPPIDQIPSEEDAAIEVPQSGQPQLFINNGIDGVQIKAEGSTPIQIDVDDILIGRTYYSVTLDETTDLNEISTLSELSVFPNPNNGIFQIKFTLDSPLQLSFKLYNNKAQLIDYLPFQDYVSGYNLLNRPFKSSNLQNGVYWMIIDDGITQTGHRIVVIQ